MSIRAVFFDLGGVILRTEYQAPRQHLAEKLGMEYDDLVKVVFDSEFWLSRPPWVRSRRMRIGLR